MSSVSPLGIFHAKRGRHGARLLAGDELVHSLEHDLALAFVGALLVRFVAPEIVAVDVAVGEPQAAVVRMIVGFAGNIGDHGEAARHDFAIGGAQRMQVGFGGLRTDVEIGERLAVDLHGDLFLALLRDLDLRAQWQCQCEEQKNLRHALTPALTMERI